MHCLNRVAIGRPFLIMSKNILKIPGMIDAHVHLRDPGAIHKEDFYTGTCAALAGGVTVVLDMPNNPSPTITREALIEKAEIAGKKAVCDYSFYFGASQENFGEYKRVSEDVCGLKIYLDNTHGPLLVDDLLTLTKHFEYWSSVRPVCVHAEDSSVAKVSGLVAAYRKPTHFCHVSQAVEISLIKAAKENGLPVTCEVTPHHLFLTQEDEALLGPYGKMRPPLGTKRDQRALWQAVSSGVVDIIASDHAPHTRKEKKGANPPFGVPGLETTLPLLVTAVSQGRLSLERLIELTSINPARIFGLKTNNQDTYIEVDLNEEWVIDNTTLKTKCGWSPFSGYKVKGKIKAVYLRGTKVFENGKVLARPGFGLKI